MKRKTLTVEYYQDAAGQYRWRLKSANGRIVADSAEGYKTFSGASDGFAVVQDGASGAREVRIKGKKKILLWEPNAVDPNNSP